MSLAEQRRIADILDKADAIHRKRKETIALTEELLRSAFLEMFGDPVTNPRGWPVEPLGKYLRFVTSGSRGWAEHYTDHGERFIRSFDVQMDRIADDDAAYVTAPAGAEADRTRVQQDDVLLTITGSKIGRAARATASQEGAYVSQHVAILRVLPELDADFLAAFLVCDRGGQALIARAQYGQTKPGLNLAQIRAFPVPIPPPRVQAQIRDARAGLRASQERLVASLRLSEDLVASLSHDAFVRGPRC
jgi:type I restriction enzyme S subunit